MAVPIKLELYLDGAGEPFMTAEPPIHFDFDTLKLHDGPHKLRIHAIDRTGRTSVRTISFEVRNGPAIDVGGLADMGSVNGVVPIDINAYGSHYQEWDVGSAETPRAIPGWMWFVLIGVVAYCIFYGVANWSVPPAYASSPTYGRFPVAVESTVTSITAPAAPAAPAAISGTSSASAAAGASVFANNCADCHQSNGQGIPGTFPPLAGDPVVTATDPTEQIRTVLFGKSGETINGVSYSASMPAWQDKLSNDQIAAVINHERTSWGNNAPTVTPAQVDSIRKEGPPSASGSTPSGGTPSEGTPSADTSSGSTSPGG